MRAFISFVIIAFIWNTVGSVPVNKECAEFSKHLRTAGMKSKCLGNDGFPTIERAAEKSGLLWTKRNCSSVINEFSLRGYTIEDCEEADGSPIFRLDFPQAQDAASAFMACASVRGSFLASIRNYAEFRAAGNLVRWIPAMQKSPSNQNYWWTWIGMTHSSGQWRWQDNGDVPAYNRWLSGYPAQPPRNCVQIGILNQVQGNNIVEFAWWDCPCTWIDYSALCKYTNY